MAANYKIIALQVGDLIKYTTSFNEINRAAQSVCGSVSLSVSEASSLKPIDLR